MHRQDVRKSGEKVQQRFKELLSEFRIMWTAMRGLYLFHLLEDEEGLRIAKNRLREGPGAMWLIFRGLINGAWVTVLNLACLAQRGYVSEEKLWEWRYFFAKAMYDALLPGNSAIAKAEILRRVEVARLRVAEMERLQAKLDAMSIV